MLSWAHPCYHFAEYTKGKQLCDGGKAMLRLLMAVLLAGFALSGAKAQTYPTKPITLIAPFPEKSTADIMGRLLADKLSAALGQAVTVKNVPGKSGTVGVSELAKADPDGHTLILTGDAAVTTATVLYEGLAYDPKDLGAVSRLASAANAILVCASSPYTSVGDLIKAAREKPGQIKLAHGGLGFSGHVGIELLKQKASINVAVVEIATPSELQKASEEGMVDAVLLTIPPSVARIKEGKVRAIAVTGPSRSPALPEVATVAEAGFTGYDASAWFGVLAPKGTPQAVIARLHEELVKVMADPEIRRKLTELGFVLIAGSPQELRESIAARRDDAAVLMKGAMRTK